MKTSSISRPYYDQQGYDTYVLDDEHKIYAIFDGMGVSEGARYASDYCMRRLVGKAADLQRSNPIHLARLLDICATEIGRMSPNGGTTGIIVHIDDEDSLNWALVGDSRLYIYRDGEANQVGRDEGQGNMLDNYIGLYTRGCEQWGSVPNWEKFMICSDGITGDWPDQFIDRADINGAFGLATPRGICNRFIALSKKPDDKTIIVGVKDT